MIRRIGVCLMLVLASSAVPNKVHGFQGTLMATKISHCGPQQCIVLESDSLSMDSTGRVLAGAKAKIQLLDKSGRVVKSGTINEPVLFLASDVLTWESCESSASPGYVDLRN